MAQVCKVCQSKDKEEIEKQYLNGVSKRKIAQSFAVPYYSLNRHLQNHLPATLVKNQEVKDLSHSENLYERIQKVLGYAENIFQRNYAKGKDKTALDSINTQSKVYELLTKISAELRKQREGQKEVEGFKVTIQEESAALARGIENLTRAETDLLFRLEMKMCGESDEIIIADTPRPKGYIPNSHLENEDRDANQISPAQDDIESDGDMYETLEDSSPRPNNEAKTNGKYKPLPERREAINPKTGQPYKVRWWQREFDRG